MVRLGARPEPVGRPGLHRHGLPVLSEDILVALRVGLPFRPRIGADPKPHVEELSGVEFPVAHRTVYRRPGGALVIFTGTLNLPSIRPLAAVDLAVVAELARETPMMNRNVGFCVGGPE